MRTFAERLSELAQNGYRLAEAQAKVAHDALLLAMHKSGFKENCTIKGGVVMCELSRESRRTTMDLDIDFMHCSISEKSIRRVVSRWARRSGLSISIYGPVVELRQEDYRGKRVYLDITDGSIRNPVRTKVDIGVHVREDMVQEQRRFSALSEERTATLFANSREQIFAEKLLSLIRHGIMSTRTKDVFDLYYLSTVVSNRKLRSFLRALIFENDKCPLHDKAAILVAVQRTFASRRFLQDMASPKSNWLGLPPQQVTEALLSYLASVL